MIKKKLLLIGLLLLIILCSGVQSYGKEEEKNDFDELEEIKKEQSSKIDYGGIQSAIDEGMEMRASFDFKQIVNEMIMGDFNFHLNDFLKIIMDGLFLDLKQNTGILIRILLISIVAAFFKAFAASFESKQIEDMGFLVIFLIIMASVIQSYHMLNSLAYDLIDRIIGFIEVLVPSLITVTVLSGSTISSVFFSESIIMIIGIIDNVIKDFLLPVLYIILIFVILDTFTEENSLSRMVQLLKKGYEWSIKIILWLFMGIYGLQSFGLPVADGLIARTAKQTIEILPVVGTSISEISDIVLGCGAVIKNAFGIGAILALVFLAIIPTIKIILIALIYKISAACIEPISDTRLVSCLSSVGDICFLLLGTVLLVLFLCVIGIAMTLYLTNIMLYIR